MKTLIKRLSVLICISILSTACIFLGGCASPKAYSPPPKTWSLQYKEKVIVSTEPSGARIYVQDNYRGTSPLEVTLDGGDLTVKQWGSSLPLQGDIGSGYWTIKAHLDGHEPASVKVECGKTSAYQRAINELRPSSENKLPSVVVGKNAVLLYLPPLGLTGRDLRPETSSRSSSSYDQAKRDYEDALSSYNQAIEKLNSAKTKGHVGGVLSAANRSNPNPWAQLSALTLPVMNEAEIRDAERQVEIARQRLDIAKRKLDAMNWK